MCVQVMKHLRAARRPLLLVGGGCVGCEEGLLNELVEVLAMPVVYTFIGKVGGGGCCVGRGTTHWGCRWGVCTCCSGLASK